MYACMHACMHVCTYVRTSVSKYVCIYECMHLCICTYVCMHVCMYVYMHACMYVYVCVYVCIYIYIYIYIHIYIHTHICIYIHTHIYIYTHHVSHRRTEGYLATSLHANEGQKHLGMHAQVLLPHACVLHNQEACIAWVRNLCMDVYTSVHANVDLCIYACGCDKHKKQTDIYRRYSKDRQTNINTQFLVCEYNEASIVCFVTFFSFIQYSTLNKCLSTLSDLWHAKNKDLWCNCFCTLQNQRSPW